MSWLPLVPTNSTFFAPTPGRAASAYDRNGQLARRMAIADWALEMSKTAGQLQTVL
jgi:hypothetical protein